MERLCAIDLALSLILQDKFSVLEPNARNLASTSLAFSAELQKGLNSLQDQLFLSAGHVFLRVEPLAAFQLVITNGVPEILSLSISRRCRQHARSKVSWPRRVHGIFVCALRSIQLQNVHVRLSSISALEERQSHVD